MKILLGPPSKNRFSKFVKGTGNASPAGKMEVVGLAFAPSSIVVEWENSGTFYQTVYNTETYSSADHNTKQNHGTTRSLLYENWDITATGFSVWPKLNTYGYKAFKYCAYQ